MSGDRTEAIDREKLVVYRGIASLLMYLIVAQDRREVTAHFRDRARIWQTRQAVPADDAIDIACLENYELTLDAYQDVLTA